MPDEPKKTVEIFRQHIDREVFDKFVIYGTGISSQAVVENCGDYPIEGIMDVTKTGQLFCGFPVLSPEEILERQIRKIVVVARPALHAIIYKRIRKWCRENGIEVYDIYGADIAKRLQIQECDSPYFAVSYESLLQEIDNHEIISFDIFDTILMRRVYEPTDVFSLVDLEMEDVLSCSFSKMRREAERRLLQNGEPDLYQIYGQMEEMYGLESEVSARLREKELQVERKVLIVRERMRECISYCKKQGKRFYFVSDMYLPSPILEEILKERGITGYEEILVSCEHGVSKTKGLFRVLKEKARGQSYLHIGDNEAADGYAAKESGIDAFLIMSAARMMEISTYRESLSYVDGLCSRIMVGMLAAELFCDPFALYDSQGKPGVNRPQAFGYLYLAPLLLSFLVWVFKTLEGKTQDIILFSARDGWFVRHIYHILAKSWGLAALPKDVYFMVSRKAMLQSVREPEGQMGAAYKKYLDILKLERYHAVCFLELMSEGTCQAEVENLLGRKTKGLCLHKNISGGEEKYAIDVTAYFKEQSAQDNDLRFLAVRDFLEGIFIWGDREGNFHYKKEECSDEQMACLKGIYKGVREYCKCFSKIMCKLPDNMPLPDFCDELLRYTDARFSCIDIPALKEFLLDG